jgi:iron complex outermembrane receptor protein
LVALSSTGFAQPARAAESEQLVEVVVTAQKRAENLQRVPLAVTAFSATMLEDKQITSAFDLAQYTPNVQFSGVGAASASAGAFYIRGVGQFNMHATSDPAVGVYLDGVYIARSVGSNFDLGDVAQVEVLKGPQGTLFGRNTITGAVSITTKRPTFESGGSADLTVGSIDQVLARATVNAPLVDGKLAARFTIMGNERAAWGTEIDSKGKVWNLGDAQRMGGRAQLLWQVSDDLDVLFSGDGTRSRGHSTPGGLTAFTPSATSNAFNATSPVKVGPQWLVQGYTSFLNIVPNDNVDTAGASMTVTWKPRDVTIKAISAYRQQYAQTAQDFGGVPVSWITQQMTQTQWQISQELQATGDLLNGRLKYTGGLYYFEEKSHNDTWAGLFGSDLVIPATNSVRSASAYGQATYDLTDKLSITGGARYTEERKSIRVQTTLGGAVVLPDSSASAKFHSVTPMANIKYQWTDDVMTYASIARGFRSGGFNAQPFSTTDLIPTNPEKTTTYEVGAKLTGFNNRVRLNLAAFYNDYTDIQLGATTLTNGVFVYRNANAATATIYGGEMELTGVIAPGLEAYLNGSYLHSKIAPVAGFTFGNTQLPSAPKFMVQAGVKYAFSLKNQGTLTLDADTNFRTGAWPQFNPSAASRQPAYALFNARGIFEPLGSPWTFSIWAKNLTDKKYTNFGQTSGSGDVTVGWFGRPREVGATAAVKF